MGRIRGDHHRQQNTFHAALNWLADKYHIRHICISPYNSKTNGIIECSHCTICNSLVKACDSDITQWPYHATHIFWADHVTTWKATGYSPFYMAHGVEPLFLLNIIKATFLLPEITSKLDTTSLIATRAHQLAKWDMNLQQVHKHVVCSCFMSIADLEHHIAHSICDQKYPPSLLVLILNKKIEPVDLHQIGWMQDHVYFLCVARHLTWYLRFHFIPMVRMLSKLKDT